MARTKHLSNRSSSRPRKRFHFGRSPGQRTPADANRPATPSGATPVRFSSHYSFLLPRFFGFLSLIVLYISHE
uniref:Centromere specific histone 3 n=2 Tax=Musa TaxID=4640 RepID=A0A0G2UMV1_MUSAC|nr:centromere specific histone 3 [Musa acuminata AAA Group]AKI32608.1 centromere specific histone 3 [Musa ABB Group]